MAILTLVYLSKEKPMGRVFIRGIMERSMMENGILD